MTLRLVARGLLFHFRVWQLLIYFSLSNKLNNAVRLEARTVFDRETLYIKLVRSKERILYGKSLTRRQRKKLKEISFSTSHSIAQGIMLGRYLDENANISVKGQVEYSLLTLAIVNLIIAIIWLIGFGIELTSTHQFPFSATAILFSIAGVASVFPASVLFYIVAFPYSSYRKHLIKHL